MSSTSESNALEMENPKSITPKSVVRKETSKNKADAGKTKKTNFKLSDVKKPQFAPNTLIGFVNAYYRSLGKQNLTIVRKNKKTVARVRAIVPKNCPALANVRKAYEVAPADGNNVNDFIMDPYVHTAYEFIEKSKKAKKDEKNPAQFKTLCEAFGITENKTDELQIIIEHMAEFIHDTAKINGRIFNYVFGPVYADKHPSKNEVHMRYIQRAPEDLIDILKLKQANFKWTTDKFFGSDKNSIIYKYISDDKIDCDTILNIVKSKTKDSERGTTVRSEIIKLLGKDAKPAIVSEMQKSISQIRTCYSFLTYLEEITDKKQFDALVNKVVKLSEEFEDCASEIDKLRKQSVRSDKQENVWGILIAIVTRLAAVTNKLSSPIKNGKDKLPLTLLCTTLHKSGCNLNIKDKNLRADINKLATETYTDRAAFEIAKKYQSSIDKVVTPPAYNQFNPELYSKLGFILMEGWNYTKPIQKVNKSMRIAVGMALFKYIDTEVSKIASDKQSAKIVIEF